MCESLTTDVFDHLGDKNLAKEHFLSILLQLLSMF